MKSAALPQTGIARPQRGVEVQVSQLESSDSTQDTAIAGIEAGLAARLGAQRYRMWFAEHAQLALSGHQLVVRVGNQFAAEWIERNFTPDLLAVAGTVAEVSAIAVEVQEATAAHPAAGALPPPPPPTDGARHGHGAAIPVRKKPAADGGWRRFDEFVVGDCNRVGFLAAKRLADDTLGGIHNILLHGGCGVGKTHLLQALCAERRRRFPDERIRYTTGEQFTNEYIQAVRGGSIDAFRGRVRKLHLLAIDDVHFLSSKGATQAEFLHTMDAIALAGARLAIVTDAHPRALASFSEALISRLLGGMVVPVEAPDRETRRTLVQRLASTRGLELEESGVDAITDKVLGSVREIEGALARIAAVMLVEDASSAGVALVQRALAHSGAASRAAPLRIGAIVEATCQALGVERDELTATGRHRRVVLARGVVVHLARELTTLSYPEIARHLGRTAHSSAHAASERVAGMLHRGETLGKVDCPCGARTVRELVETVRRGAERAGKNGR